MDYKLTNGISSYEYASSLRSAACVIIVGVNKLYLGSELVDWLYTHVQGFANRNDARKYASSLVREGFVRHAVNKTKFSEQCYYVFGDGKFNDLVLGLMQRMEEVE